MGGPLVAIVGSVNKNKSGMYDPPLKNVDAAKTALHDLGRELSDAGYRILVYSDSPSFIEADLVSGYVSSGKAAPKSIVVRYPGKSEPAPRFPEEADDANKSVFDHLPDNSPNWQVCFYRSLKTVDAILLLGGADSAMVTFLVAEMQDVALAPIATFGGSAQTIWHLASEKYDDETRRITNARDWDAQSAAKVVKAIDRERVRVQKEKERKERSEQARNQESAARRRAREFNIQALLTAGLLIVAVALTWLGSFGQVPDSRLIGAFFLGTPLVAGATGGVGRNLLDFYREERARPGHTFLVSMVLGMIAGLIAAILFVAAQWASNPAARNFDQEIPPGLRLLVIFELVIGLLSGFTLDSLFKRWEETPPTFDPAQPRPGL